MAVIGSLAVNIIAKLNPFAKGMNDARRHVHGFRKDVTMLGVSLASMAKAAVLAGGSYGIGRFIKSSVTAMDELGELSDRIGINVGELQGLQHAAKLSGVSVDALTSGLEKLNVFIGQGQKEGRQRDILEDLGLNPKRLAHMPIERAFGKIANELNKIESSSERAARAKEIFGRGAGQLNNVLNLGSGGLRRYSKEFEKLHGKMTDQQKEKVSAFADAMDRLGVAMGGIGQSFVISIADPAIKAINKLVELSADFKRGMSFFKALTGDDIKASAMEAVTPRWMDPHGVLRNRLNKFLGDAGVGGISEIQQQSKETLEDFNRGWNWIKSTGQKVGGDLKTGWSEYTHAWGMAGQDWKELRRGDFGLNTGIDKLLQRAELTGRGTNVENMPQNALIRGLAHLVSRLDSALRDDVLEARKNKQIIVVKPAGL